MAGPTAWGTTLAVLLARNGHGVTLLARSEAEARTLEADRRNRRRCPELAFPDNLRATADPSVLAGAGLVVLAVPSATMRWNLERVAPLITEQALVLSATKGLEPDTGRRMSELVVEAGVHARRILVLSGPNFSDEIARGLPAATVIAGGDLRAARRVQAAFMSPVFRVYAGDDVVGVEVGGALKNVAAIACGVADGLGMGNNARAGLMTRALAEITRLGVALGARPATFLGLSGLGDLIGSCSSDLSRNRRLGLAIAAGGTPEGAAASIGVVEGLQTVRAVRPLQERAGVDMPISSQVYAVLFEGKDVRTAMADLMGRAARDELDPQR